MTHANTVEESMVYLGEAIISSSNSPIRFFPWCLQIPRFWYLCFTVQSSLFLRISANSTPSPVSLVCQQATRDPTNSWAVRTPGLPVGLIPTPAQARPCLWRLWWSCGRGPRSVLLPRFGLEVWWTAQPSCCSFSLFASFANAQLPVQNRFLLHHHCRSSIRTSIKNAVTISKCDWSGLFQPWEHCRSELQDFRFRGVIFGHVQLVWTISVESS